MYLLISTAGATARIALYSSDSSVKLIEEEVFEQDRTLSDRLLRVIDELCTRCNCSLKDLRGIVCVNGPGHFTSIRLGVLCANTLAFSLELPLVACTEDEVRQGLTRLTAGESDDIAIPVYDAEPHITFAKPPST